MVCIVSTTFRCLELRWGWCSYEVGTYRLNQGCWSLRANSSCLLSTDSFVHNPGQWSSFLLIRVPSSSWWDTRSQKSLSWWYSLSLTLDRDSGHWVPSHQVRSEVRTGDLSHESSWNPCSWWPCYSHPIEVAGSSQWIPYTKKSVHGSSRVEPYQSSLVGTSLAALLPMDSHVDCLQANPCRSINW